MLLLSCRIVSYIFIFTFVWHEMSRVQKYSPWQIQIRRRDVCRSMGIQLHPSVSPTSALQMAHHDSSLVKRMWVILMSRVQLKLIYCPFQCVYLRLCLDFPNRFSKSGSSLNGKWLVHGTKNTAKQSCIKLDTPLHIILVGNLNLIPEISFKNFIFICDIHCIDIKTCL